MTLKYHVDESTKGSYNMILGRDLLAALSLDFKFSNRVVVGVKVPYKGCLETMVDVSNYNYSYLTDKIVKPEESFLNLYASDFFESENTIDPTRRTYI